MQKINVKFIIMIVFENNRKKYTEVQYNIKIVINFIYFYFGILKFLDLLYLINLS